MELARLGLMGKHPGYGDFLRQGLSDHVVEGLSAWLDRTLPSLRDDAAEHWPSYWDSARRLRFWIGPEVFGATLAGILQPSNDKVGRRYPFLLLAEGAAVAAPVADAAQTVYESLEDHIAAMTPGVGAQALLAGLDLEIPAEAGPAEGGDRSLVFAHRTDGDLDKLLRAAAPVDCQYGMLGRSYWWCPGQPGMAAVWLGQAGLPGPASLGWLLAPLSVSEPAPAAASTPDKARQEGAP